MITSLRVWRCTAPCSSEVDRATGPQVVMDLRSAFALRSSCTAKNGDWLAKLNIDASTSDRFPEHRGRSSSKWSASRVDASRVPSCAFPAPTRRYAGNDTQSGLGLSLIHI